VEIPQSIVRKVKIVNRGDCCGDRTKNVKVWVGNQLPTTTNTEYSQGALIGTFVGPGTNGQVIEVTSQKGFEGRFVVVQMSLTEVINLAEIEVYGKPAVTKEIAPVAVRMSSVWRGYHQGVRELPGHLCTDNKLGPISICHTKGGETWPWIAVEIPQSIVRKVKIINRGDCCGDRTKNMKVWIGDYLPTTTDTEYSQGALIGTFMGPGTTGQVIEVTSQNGFVGKFVVVQMSLTQAINLAEIEVFGEPAVNDGSFK